MKLSYWLLAALLCAPLALADIPTTNLTGRYNFTTITGGNLTDTSGFSPQLNANLMGNATFDSALQQANITGGSGYVRINTTVPKYSPAARNVTYASWQYFAQDLGTNYYKSKIGAGTPAILDYCQYSSSNNWRLDVWNSSGTNEFYTSNLACPTSTWSLYVTAIHANGTTRTYRCDENGSVQTGNVFTPTGGTYRTPSNDAYLFGGDGGTGGLVGSQAAILIYNRTISATDVQTLCDYGRNTESDKFTATANYNSALGTTTSTAGLNVATWEVANYSAINPYNPRVDCASTGNENCNASQASITTVRQAFENVTSANGNLRTQLSGNDLRDAGGNLKACSQSAFASICMVADTVRYAASVGKRVTITLFETDQDLRATTYCANDADAPPSNMTTWASRRLEELAYVGCGNYTDASGQSICDVEILNEPDLNLFYCSNQTSRRQTWLTDYVVNQTAETIRAVRTHSNATIAGMNILLPAMSDVRYIDASYFKNATLNNRTNYYSTANVWPMSFHLYTDYWDNTERPDVVWNTSVAFLGTRCSAAGWNSTQCATLYPTEWGTGNAADQNGTNGQTGYDRNANEIALIKSWILNNPQYVVKDNYYRGTAWSNSSVADWCGDSTTGRNHCVIMHPFVTNQSIYQSPYRPLKLAQTTPYGSTVATCTSTDPSIVCIISKNASTYRATVINTKSINRTGTITLAGVTATSVRNLETNATSTVTNGSFTLTDLAAYDFESYELNATLIPQAPTYTYNTWFVNGTGATPGLTSIGAEITMKETVQGVTVVFRNNTLNNQVRCVLVVDSTAVLANVSITLNGNERYCEFPQGIQLNNNSQYGVFIQNSTGAFISGVDYAEGNSTAYPSTQLDYSRGSYYMTTGLNMMLYTASQTWGFSYIRTALPTTLQITAIDAYNATALTSFNATVEWNGITTNYSTTNGTIVTTATVNSTLPANITVTPSQTNYFSIPQTFTNYDQNQTILQSNATPYTVARLTQAYNGTTIQNFTVNFTNGVDTGSAVTTSGLAYLPLFNSTYNLTFTATGLSYLTNTTVATASPYLQSINATLTPYTLVRAYAYNGTQIQNFSLNWTGPYYTGSTTTTSGIAYAPVYNGTYEVTVYDASLGAVNLAQAYANLTGNPYLESYNFTGIKLTNSFFFTLYNETTNEQLTSNVTIQLVSQYFAANYTFSGGAYNVSLLVPDYYQITYWVDPDVPREYYTTLTNQSAQTLRLYTIDENQRELYSPVALNQFGRACGNQTVSLLRYYVDQNAYRVVEMSKTDTNGAAVLSVQPNIINYKLQFSGSCGDYTSEPQKITAATNSFTITDGQSNLEPLQSYSNTLTSLFFVNATNTFGLNWVDNASTLSNVCLRVQGYSGLATIDDTTQCLDASTGSLIYTVNDTNGTRYTATATYTTTSGSTFYDSLTQDYNTAYGTFGLTGVFITLLVLLAFVAMGSYSPDAVVIYGFAAIALMGVFSVVAFNWTYVVGIAIIVGYIVYKMGRT